MRKLLVVLVLILTATAAYLWFVPKSSHDVLQTDNELLPDYIALKITRRLFDQQGKLVDTISADRLEHFDLLGFTQFEKPVYTLYNGAEQASWQASSQYAVWFPQDKVILEQQVRIESLLPGDLIKHIETSTLEMLFPDNKLQNNQPVLIQGNGFYIKGIGIEADLTNKTFQLFQHEKTVYLNEN